MLSKYFNPWPSFKLPAWYSVFASVHTRRRCSPMVAPHVEDVKVLKPDFSFNSDRPQCVWLGHAWVYILIPTVNGRIGILFDPIFSLRCSPIPWLGPKRRTSIPCEVNELPVVDIVLISHDHYDHLDKASILSIRRFHTNCLFVVPQGVAKIMSNWGVPISIITELSWWQETSIATDRASDSLSSSDLSPSKSSFAETKKSLADPPVISLSETDQSIRVICTPAQHNSGRTVFSQNSTLWASWTVIVPLPDGLPFTIFFGGDTGYRSRSEGPVCPVFKEISETFGPPDVSFLPIAAGSVLPFLEEMLKIRFDHHKLTSSIHCSPGDAVDVHRDMKSEKSIAIHWGTFTTRFHALQSKQELETAVKERTVDKPFGVVDIGQIVDL